MVFLPGQAVKLRLRNGYKSELIAGPVKGYGISLFRGKKTKRGTADDLPSPWAGYGIYSGLIIGNTH
jgi:hypothetical protein